MIPEQWYPIYPSKSLRPHRAVGIKRLDQLLVLWRKDDGTVACMPDRCPHRAALLSRGRVREGCIECPYHGFLFNAQGTCVRIPVNGAAAPIPHGFDIDPLVVREEHGLIWLWHGEAADIYPPVPWLPPASWENGSIYTTTAELDVSYLRAMENMGDFFHLPFVHRTTLPGAGTRMVDFDAHVEDGVVKVAGTLRPEGVAGPSWRDYTLRGELMLPGVARVLEASRLNLLLCVTPIERDRCWMFLRYAQGYLPRWLGGQLLAHAAAWIDLNVVFRWQDVPTLKSQQLDDPGDISQYHLVHADRASALYFGLRKRAIEETALRAQVGQESRRVAAG
jgi:nitrite reductase/ring-hydroxylating ferredoxin subunit